MTGLDIAIIVTVLLAATIGFWRGILRPIIGIAGFFAGLILAAAWYRPLAETLWPGEGAWASAVSYLIILLVVLGLTGVVAGAVSRTVHATPFGVVDRVIGLIVAFLLSLGAWIVALALVLALAPGSSAAISQSFLAHLLLSMLADTSPSLSDVTVHF
ncbi:MAG: CvpA family protein [Chloroflexota bacterium]